MNRWLGSVLLTAVLTVGTAFHSQAFFETADGLTAHCNNDDVLRFTECVAFLKGVADGLRTLAFRERVDAPACVPGGARSEDLRAAFLGYATRTPHLGDVAASSVAIDAFAERWPCK